VTQTTRTREVAFGISIVGFCFAALFGIHAIQAATLSSWPDKTSPRFPLTPDSRGSWEPRWEPTILRDRDRPLVLRYDGTDTEARPRELDLVVRVAPREALHEWWREHADGDGWIRHTLEVPSLLAIAEPALVRRVEWKIGGVQPTHPTLYCTLHVPGDPDSEEPRLWPLWATMTAFALGVASALLRWARGSGGRARAATFDVI